MNIKTINIDFDSLEDCEKLFNQLKCVLGTLRKTKSGILSKNDRTKEIFECCYNIFNTDISSVYEKLILDETPKYYVYAHCDSGFKIALKKEARSTFVATLGLEYMPFYFGKGTGNRAFELDRNESHRKVRQKLKIFNKEITVKIIKDGLTEKEALMYESKLIDIFGLITHGGRLVNLDEGINSKERRKLYSDELSKINSFYKNSIEHNRK
jgi:hypothetical protein